MSLLCDLAIKHGTDKGPQWHGYTEEYDKLLSSDRMDVRNVLEMGIMNGASHKMWVEYFPNAKIYGFDMNECESVGPNIFFYCVNQSDQEDVESFCRVVGAECKFDLVVDDASHCMRDQQMSLGILWPMLKPGGYYIIEDCATEMNLRRGKHSLWGEKDRVNFTDVTLNCVERWKRTGTLDMPYLKHPVPRPGDVGIIWADFVWSKQMYGREYTLSELKCSKNFPGCCAIVLKKGKL